MKVELHQALTRIALKKYEEKKSITLSSDLKNQIIYGSKAEDNWWEPSRLWNWHFFYQNDAIEKETNILKMHRTSDSIFDKRVKQMQDNKYNSKKYGECLGRVLHHIQDMHTPSHVVPIYHVGDDYFEAFMVDALGDGKLDPIIPLETWESFYTLKSQYSLAAKNTFMFIKNRTLEVSYDKKNVTLNLSLFWRDYTTHEDPKRSGFGTFSEAQKVFKKSKAHQYETNFIYEGKSYDITLEEMYKICNEISGRAIKETIRTLDYIRL
ncbi:MAG: Unknown protein [uncultured Sulfurovum sp.]|uniref:Phospholipase C/D domain-containing protein n=1 Tax=uncultured Sulfurovum sp. TaxID=269237 RepID=A0A6S6UCV2_9BACT|nr:MAG: Unknown protein [uncultured Sulfurovum sp.]